MTAKVPIEIWASVGGGEALLLGTIEAPVSSSKIDEPEGLVINLAHQFRRMKNSVEFMDPNDAEE